MYDELARNERLPQGQNSDKGKVERSANIWVFQLRGMLNLSAHKFPF